ncbi:MAG: YARHG domain-containing protein [Clostridia bacterium]|nr:YARHG domain-containing protein [Clostridia bacterium]
MLIIIIGVLVPVSAALITFMALNGGAPSATPSPSPIATASPTPTPTSTPTPTPTAPPAPAAQPAQAVPAAPPAQSSAAVTSGFVFPSDSVYISEADLNGRSQDEVRLIMNEMYARHGYIFSSSSYQDYFSSKSWYVPVSTSQAEAERKFNSIELANKNVISNYEKKRGWR